MINSLLKKFLPVRHNHNRPHITTNTTHSIALPQMDSEGWITPYSAAELLNTELRQKYLSTLWQQVSMTQEMFNSLYLSPIEHYAEMVQLLPASESHHHAHLGGMLDHGLEVLSFAAKLRQNYVLPQNAAPEEQSKQRDVWTATVIYTALVHDIGKVIVDIEMQLKNGQRWFAWHGIPEPPYKFHYIKNRDYELHPILGGFIANQLIPKEAFDWLGQYQEAFSAFMYAIAGHYDKAGLLSEIVQKADQNSVALALGGDVTKLVQKPAISFTKQIVMALRHLLKQKFKINTPKGPADGWFTGDALWMMSKTMADQIRAYLLEQGISVPQQNPKFFSEMQSLGIIESTSQETAIWRCRVKADSGWAPPTAFSLLKIKPEVAWEDISDRPELFLGRIDIEADNSDESAAEHTETQMQTQDIEIEETLPITAAVTMPESVENKINSVSASNSEFQNMSDFVLDLFADTSVADNEPENTDKTKTEVPIVYEIEESKSAEIQQSAVEKVEKPQKITDPHQEKKEKCSLMPDDILSGKSFANWLKQSIMAKKLPLNSPTAKLHIVDSKLFLVTPGIFQLYIQSIKGNFTKEEVESLQYSFQELKLHRKYRLSNNDSVNFWRCNVVGPRKISQLIGYLIDDPKYFFGNQILIDNLHLSLIKEEKNE